MSDTKTDIIRVITETWIESLARDAGTFGGAFVLIGIGHWLGSSAMQWFGFITVLCGAIARSSARWPKKSPQEAADYLKTKYGVTAR